MSRRSLLPLLCLLAWAPLAQAFPPCPKAPVDLLDSSDDGASFKPDSPAWARGWYTSFQPPGDEPSPSSGDDPNTGKCEDHDVVPVPQTATPGNGALGVVALPDVRYLDGKLTVHYTLHFTVDNLPLASAGDTIELARLEFETSDTVPLSYPQTLTAVYRVRKRQPASGAPVLEVLESLMPVDPDTGAVVLDDTVVATLPMSATLPATAIGLRWTQFLSEPGSEAGGGDGTITLPPLPWQPEPSPVYGPGDLLDGVVGTDTATIPQPVFARSVDSQLDVLDGNGDAIYRASLPLQWASTLSMGLLDHQLANSALYADPDIATLDEMSLQADAE